MKRFLKRILFVLFVILLCTGYLVSARCNTCEESLKIYKDSQRSNDWFQKGLDLYYDGRYEQAISAFDQAYLIDPSMTSVYKLRGKSYLALGEYEKAISEFKKSLRGVISDTEDDHFYYGQVWNGMGVAYENLGEYKDALDAYENARELDPDEDLYQENIDNIKRKIE